MKTFLLSSLLVVALLNLGLHLYHDCCPQAKHPVSCECKCKCDCKCGCADKTKEPCKKGKCCCDE